MKNKFILIAGMLCVLIYGCNSQSSPEGRSKIRDTALKAQIDSLKFQVNSIQERLDSLEKQP